MSRADPSTEVGMCIIQAALDPVSRIFIHHGLVDTASEDREHLDWVTSLKPQDAVDVWCTALESWVAAEVLKVEPGRVRVHMLDLPNTMDRFVPCDDSIVPRGTHSRAPEVILVDEPWRTKLLTGDKFDYLNAAGRWVPATVKSCIEKPLDDEGVQGELYVKVHISAWYDDEWCSSSSLRMAPSGTRLPVGVTTTYSATTGMASVSPAPAGPRGTFGMAAVAVQPVRLPTGRPLQDDEDSDSQVAVNRGRSTGGPLFARLLNVAVATGAWDLPAEYCRTPAGHSAEQLSTPPPPESPAPEAGKRAMLPSPKVYQVALKAAAASICCFSRPWATSQLREFLLCLPQALQAASTAELRGVTVAWGEAVANSAATVAARALGDAATAELERVSLSVARELLQLDMITQRLVGVSIAADAAEAALSDKDIAMGKEQLAQWLEQHLLGLAFDPRRTHPEIVRRMQKVLQLLHATGHWDEDILLRLWRLALDASDSTARASIFEVLGGLAKSLPAEAMLPLVHRVASTKLDTASVAEVALLSQLASPAAPSTKPGAAAADPASQPDTDAGEPAQDEAETSLLNGLELPALHAIWRLLDTHEGAAEAAAARPPPAPYAASAAIDPAVPSLQDSTLPTPASSVALPVFKQPRAKVQDAAIGAACSIIIDTFPAHRASWAAFAVSRAAALVNPVRMLQVARRLINSFPVTAVLPGDVTRVTAASALESRVHVLTTLATLLADLAKRAATESASAELAPGNTLSSAIQDVLALITDFCGIDEALHLSSEQVDELWQAFTAEQVPGVVRESLMRFIVSEAGDGGLGVGGVLPASLYESLLLGPFARADVATLSLSDFAALRACFMVSNAAKGWLQRVPGSATEAMATVNPAFLLGESLLWTIALEAGVEDAGSAARNLVLSLHMNLAPGFGSSAEVQTVDFTGELQQPEGAAALQSTAVRTAYFERLSTELCQAASDDAASSVRVARLIGMLTSLLKGRDELGGVPAAPHAMASPKLRWPLAVSASLGTSSGITLAPEAAKFELAVWNCTTLSAVRATIAQHIGLPEQRLKLTLAGKELLPAENDAPLFKLGVEQTSTLSVSYKPPPPVRQAPLLISQPAYDRQWRDAHMTRLAERALSEIFARFCFDGRMTAHQFKLYLVACGVGGTNISDSRVRNIFKSYHTTPSNELTLQGFLEFYQQASVERPDSVRKDLRQHGYDTSSLRLQDTSMQQGMASILADAVAVEDATAELTAAGDIPLQDLPGGQPPMAGAAPAELTEAQKRADREMRELELVAKLYGVNLKESDTYVQKRQAAVQEHINDAATDTASHPRLVVQEQPQLFDALLVLAGRDEEFARTAWSLLGKLPTDQRAESAVAQAKSWDWLQHLAEPSMVAMYWVQALLVKLEAFQDAIAERAAKEEAAAAAKAAADAARAEAEAEAQAEAEAGGTAGGAMPASTAPSATKPAPPSAHSQLLPVLGSPSQEFLDSRAEWRPAFVSAGGLDAVVGLLQALAQRDTVKLSPTQLASHLRLHCACARVVRLLCGTALRCTDSEFPPTYMSREVELTDALPTEPAQCYVQPVQPDAAASQQPAEGKDGKQADASARDPALHLPATVHMSHSEPDSDDAKDPGTMSDVEAYSLMGIDMPSRISRISLRNPRLVGYGPANAPSRRPGAASKEAKPLLIADSAVWPELEASLSDPACLKRILAASEPGQLASWLVHGHQVGAQLMDGLYAKGEDGKYVSSSAQRTAAARVLSRACEESFAVLPALLQSAGSDSVPAALQVAQQSSVPNAWVQLLISNARGLRREVAHGVWYAAGSSGSAASAVRQHVQAALLAALDMVADAAAASAPCTHYFAVLTRVMESSLTASSGSHVDGTPHVDPELAKAWKSLTARLLRHAPVESRVGGVDMLLRGVLQTLASVAKAAPSLAAASARELMVHVFRQCLFASPKSALDMDESAAPKPPLAKRTETRAAAFSLMESLVASSPGNMSTLLPMVEEALASASHHTSKWNYTPGAAGRAACGYVGLHNLGCICYMNATLQQLFMIPRFRYAVLAAPCPAEDVLESEDQAVSRYPRVLYQLQRLFGYLSTSLKRDYNPTPWCSNFMMFGAPVDVRIQQDAEEFLNALLDQLGTALQGTPMASLVHDVITGEIVHQTLDPESNRVLSQTTEPFHHMSLTVKDTPNVVTALEAYIAGSEVSGYRYEPEDRVMDVVRRTRVAKLPSVLMLHCKRFEFSLQTFVMEKVNSRFEFPEVVDMQPYMVDELARSKPSHPDAFKYKLSGVIVHSGTAQGGHYYSFIRDRATRDWFEFNDSTVRPFSAARLEEETFGGSEDGYMAQWGAGKSGYMLVYERVAPMDGLAAAEAAAAAAAGMQYDWPEHTMAPPGWLPLHGSADEPSAEQRAAAAAASAEEDATPEQRAAAQVVKSWQAVQAASSFTAKLKHMADAIAAARQASSPTKASHAEAEADAEEASVLSLLPQRVAQEVHQENLAFLADQGVYDPSFFKFMGALLRAMAADLAALPAAGSEQRAQDLVQLVMPFVVEIQAFSTSAEDLAGSLGALSGVLGAHPAAAAALVQYYLNHSDACNLVIIMCPARKARQALADLVAEALKHCPPDQGLEFTLQAQEELQDVPWRPLRSATAPLEAALCVVLDAVTGATQHADSADGVFHLLAALLHREHLRRLAIQCGALELLAVVMMRSDAPRWLSDKVLGAAAPEEKPKGRSHTAAAIAARRAVPIAVLKPLSQCVRMLASSCVYPESSTVGTGAAKSGAAWCRSRLNVSSLAPPPTLAQDMADGPLLVPAQHPGVFVDVAEGAAPPDPADEDTWDFAGYGYIVRHCAAFVEVLIKCAESAAASLPADTVWQVPCPGDAPRTATATRYTYTAPPDPQADADAMEVVENVVATLTHVTWENPDLLMSMSRALSSQVLMAVPGQYAALWYVVSRVLRVHDSLHPLRVAQLLGDPHHLSDKFAGVGLGFAPMPALRVNEDGVNVREDNATFLARTRRTVVMAGVSSGLLQAAYRRRWQTGSLTAAILRLLGEVARDEPSVLLYLCRLPPMSRHAVDKPAQPAGWEELQSPASGLLNGPDQPYTALPAGSESCVIAEVQRAQPAYSQRHERYIDWACTWLLHWSETVGCGAHWTLKDRQAAAGLVEHWLHLRVAGEALLDGVRVGAAVSSVASGWPELPRPRVIQLATAMGGYTPAPRALPVLQAADEAWRDRAARLACELIATTKDSGLSVSQVVFRPAPGTAIAAQAGDSPEVCMWRVVNTLKSPLCLDLHIHEAVEPSNYPVLPEKQPVQMMLQPRDVVWAHVTRPIEVKYSTSKQAWPDGMPRLDWGSYNFRWVYHWVRDAAGEPMAAIGSSDESDTPRQNRAAAAARRAAERPAVEETTTPDADAPELRPRMQPLQAEDLDSDDDSTAAVPAGNAPSDADADADSSEYEELPASGDLVRSDSDLARELHEQLNFA